MDDDTGLIVACGVLLAGALQSMAQRTANGVDREFSPYVDSLRHAMREKGRNATNTTKVVLGISLAVYLLVRRRREGRMTDPSHQLAGAAGSLSSPSVAAQS
jgi:hypothetical protein